MAAGGIPIAGGAHAIDSVLAALEIQEFMSQMRASRESEGRPYWQLRLGIHSGPLVAGVIGREKFAYDVWGDTVNTASRLESSGVAGRINISKATYNMVKDYFECEYRGMISAKNKGEIDMYFVNAIRSEFAQDANGLKPNRKLLELTKNLSSRT
jgi:class 3 adenylate cyclase